MILYLSSESCISVKFEIHATDQNKFDVLVRSGLAYLYFEILIIKNSNLNCITEEFQKHVYSLVPDVIRDHSDACCMEVVSV